MFYKENKPAVNSEVFDDEVVIVNLENGNYYSTSETGAAVWKLIAAGVSFGDIVSHINRSNEAIQAEEELTEFIELLLKESLIVGTKEGGELTEFPEISYSKPQLSKYSDMQDLLLLDPIHEVDQTGWPMQPKSGEGSEKQSN